MKYQIKVLPKTDNPLNEMRESLETHSSFQLELDLFNSIKEGNVKKLEAAMKGYLDNGFVIGHMSDTPILEIKYWAISTISLATHYAILGGLDESDAYNLSDSYIHKIDTFHTFEECINYLKEQAYILTKKVNQNQKPLSSKIKKCVHYIHIHLYEKLAIESLADYLDISRDYLSVLFKKETGVSIHQYILKEKLEESKNLIASGMSFKDISYTLNFCSQTHFIKAFKKEYSITPFEYKKSL